MKELPRISESEWQLMQVLWKENPLNSTQIAKKAGLHLQTTKTFLGRLVRKEALTYEKQGRFFQYRPIFSEAECQKQASKTFLDRVFGGSLQPMLSFLVEDDSLSQEELKRLQKILEQKKQK